MTPPVPVLVFEASSSTSFPCADMESKARLSKPPPAFIWKAEGGSLEKEVDGKPSLGKKLALLPKFGSRSEVP